MEDFKTFFIRESLADIGRLKIYRPKDILNSHRFKTRGITRKSLEQVPKIHRTTTSRVDTSGSNDFTNFIRGLEVSNKVVDVAKKASSGVWKLTKPEVLEIAKKYKFNVPNREKPMKHLGSTGIQIVRYKPGMYYLYKPHRKTKKKKLKSIKKAMSTALQFGYG